MTYTIAKIDALEGDKPRYGKRHTCRNFKAVGDALKGDRKAWGAGAGAHVLDSLGQVLFHTRHYDYAGFISHGAHVPLSLVLQVVDSEAT